MAGWWRSARTAAAHEFGRRHYRGIAAVEVAWRVLPAAMVGGAVAALVWGVRVAWRWSTRTVSTSAHSAPMTGWVHQWGPTVLAVALAVSLVAAVVWAVRRWGWMAILYVPVEPTAAWVVGGIVGGVVLLGVGGAATWWALS